MSPAAQSMDPGSQQYADDTPITSSTEDRFGRARFAERIAQVLLARPDSPSVVVGLYGPWGDGKTSVLNMMDGYLAGFPDVVRVRFNPWLVATDANLGQGLCDTIAASFRLAGIDEVPALLGQYGRASARLAHSHTPYAAAVSVPADAGTEALSIAELEALKTKISGALVHAGRRTVVLVDDIDRLDRSGIHALLKLVNLAASFTSMTFVLALDADVVAAAIGERYGAAGTEAGRQFLEKIIQVPVHLPDAERADLQQACLEGIDGVITTNRIAFSERDADAFVRHFSRGLAPALRTPRQVKRYLNSIRFAVPMLLGEVHLLDQLLLEALRTVYPRVYLCVRDNPAAFTGELPVSASREAPRAPAQDLIDAALFELPETHRTGALYLLKVLFPRLNSVFGTTSYGAEWNNTWALERRLASADYFRRYFQYAVPRRDIGDAAITRVIDACRDSNQPEIDAFFTTVRDNDAWAAAFNKLRSRLAGLDAASQTMLARSIAQHASALPRVSGKFAVVASPARQAAALAADLAAEQPLPSRVETALELMGPASSLEFAADCFRALTTTNEFDMAALDAAATARVGASLANRVAQAMTVNGPAALGSEVAALLSVWRVYGTDGAATAFLTAWFDTCPKAVLSFLSAFASTEDGVAARGITPGGFGGSGFQAVALLVPSARLAAIVRSQLRVEGEDLTLEALERFHEDERAAVQFLLAWDWAQRHRAP